jgi:hypothetical protein
MPGCSGGAPPGPFELTGAKRARKRGRLRNDDDARHASIWEMQIKSQLDHEGRRPILIREIREIRGQYSRAPSRYNAEFPVRPGKTGTADRICGSAVQSKKNSGLDSEYDRETY